MIYINYKEKLDKFKELEDYYVITDFDRTLTTKESEPSMGIVPQYLGGECLKERTKIFNHYRPLELDYTINAEEKQKIMKEWATKSFTLLTKYVTEETINGALESANIHLRDGAKGFLKEMSNKNVPVIVMSSGIGNIVETFLKKENCLFNNIIIVSNFFEFNNRKTHIDINNIMATSNKEYIRIPSDVRNIIEEKQMALLFGDLIEDIKMVNTERINNTVTFGFLDDNIDKNLETYNKSFDIVLTDNEDFNSVKKILNI